MVLWLQGEYLPLAGSGASNMQTDGAGVFRVERAAPARYTFAADSAGDNICVDSVTLQRARFPMRLSMPVVPRAVVTPIALLVQPASKNAMLPSVYGASAEVVPTYLWRHVYQLYGFNDTKLQVRHGRAAGAARLPGQLAGVQEFLLQTGIRPLECMMPCLVYRCVIFNQAV